MIAKLYNLNYSLLFHRLGYGRDISSYPYPTWSLVAEKEECTGDEKLLDYDSKIKSVDECANACDGLSTMFAFGTNDFGEERCDNDGNCKCSCETGAHWYDTTCTKKSHLGYRLYKYTVTGKKTIL